MCAVEGVFIGLQQPTSVGWRPQQVGTFAKSGVVLGRDQDSIPVLRDDLDCIMVFVDLLDQREESFARLACSD